MDSGLDNGFPVRDQGVSREISGQDVVLSAASHRNQAMYLGLRLPHRPRRPRRGASLHRTEKPTQEAISAAAAMTPSEQIHLLLSQTEEDENNETHDVFCQMDYLFKIGNDVQWREMARWVKYEEDVEQGGERWSKPHVASLSLHSLFELRGCIVNGCVILEMDAYHITQIADLLLDNLINGKHLEESLRDQVRQAIVANHVFQHSSKRRRMSTPDHADIKKMSMKRTFSEFGQKFSIRNRDASSAQLKRNGSTMQGYPMSQPNLEAIMNGDIPQSPSSARLNQPFMRKIPEGAEAANVMVGEMEGLSYQVMAFIRLCEARGIGDLTEVPISSRFLFFLLGPVGSQHKITEIGRSMSTIMVDEVFREVAYKARHKQDILAGIDEFLDQVTALPPGEWDPKIRIEPPQTVPSQTQRKVPKPAGPPVDEEEEESHCDPTLQRTGRLFGGLIQDIKRKVPFYLSDFKDCLHIQCVASIIYLYLATLTPNVTFGGLLGQATDQYMGTMECIFTASIVGVLFALFAGQPLNILGSTGPMLVLEMILYHFCKDNDLDFLPFRCWIGLWTSVILILIVAFDLSALVRYITRFTEESFACLIAIIFIAEAFKKLIGILDKAPINFDADAVLDYNCTCFPPGSDVNISVVNSTLDNMTMISPMPETFSYIIDSFTSTLNITVGNETMLVNWTELTTKECKKYGGVLMGSGCDTPHYVADAFLLSVLLFLGTFTISSGLTSFKNSTFFPTYVRQTLSDFAVLIAILMMVGADVLIGIKTPKLMVPAQFKPTRDDRGWFINPISDKNPWWLTLAAVVPALLATILIFMDQQITAVIVNRKENKLKKGSGYHLDLFVVAICITICSLLGLPWYVAATVSAIAHIISLKKESECTAPGERPTFLGVREQRVTALMVGLLSGLSILFTSVLKFIPMAVLYGVFLFMGVAALKGMQFIDRILLMFMPAKYQPDHIYLRHVRIKRCHLFTLLQIFCLVVLWVVKTIKSVSIIFPIMVLGTCFVRKAMDYIFQRNELKWLDDVMPEDKSKRKEDAKKQAEDEAEKQSLLDEDDNYQRMMDYKIQDEMTAGKYGMDYTRRGSIDPDRVNITEEMTKTSIWKNLTHETLGENEHNKLNKRRKEHKDKDNKASFYIQDDDGVHHHIGHSGHSGHAGHPGHDGLTEHNGGDDKISKV